MTPTRQLPTLAEFLLARIAEDEERARKLMRYAQENHLKVQEPRFLGREIPGWHQWPDVEALCARVLAECEAKRRLVERHDGDDSTSFGEPCPTLRLLAVPYASHEDYREEWRP